MFTAQKPRTSQMHYPQITEGQAMTISDDAEVADEWVCGESIDHDERVTYEDAEVKQWECLRCGAEGWEDLDG